MQGGEPGEMPRSPQRGGAADQRTKSDTRMDRLVRAAAATLVFTLKTSPSHARDTGGYVRIRRQPVAPTQRQGPATTLA
ncbi:hypothetical protein CO2235_MP40160 [Cupriavidus oxalaticus]|uniref:Uncharacterized protein n=1 Tax=Cupriavidus oxalaticus TaxID=96344 RepID=A0A976GCV4_9BURK|nr:hypothetical protein CO2235_MP40160 [Cupriavidus oxalaticus]